MQATQSAVSIGDWGYQVFGTTGNPPHEFAQVQYRSPWALVQLGADRIGHLVSSQVEAQGAISIVGGGVFASNAIDDSFAVVDTNGLKGVRVLRENRLVGRTDSKGRLLVPGLRSFDLNRVSIDPNDVPLDSSIDIAVREVRPQDRSGIVVKFGVQVSHGALLRLVDAAGTPIQLGSTARLAPKGVLVPVGYDGEAYVLDLSPHNQLLVERPGGDRCEAAFDYKPIPGQIPTIGPLPCLEKAP
jgi:outer membrane usher protein